MNNTSTTLSSLIERANNTVTSNKLEDRVVKLRASIQCDLDARLRNPSKTVGKLISRAWDNYNKQALIFDDGAFIAFETEFDRDYEGCICVVSLTCEEGIEAGLVEDNTVKQLRKAERAWQEAREDTAGHEQLRQALALLGADKVKEIVKMVKGEQ